jgi:hypothetical protein
MISCEFFYSARKLYFCKSSKRFRFSEMFVDFDGTFLNHAMPNVDNFYSTANDSATFEQTVAAIAEFNDFSSKPDKPEVSFCDVQNKYKASARFSISELFVEFDRTFVVPDANQIFFPSTEQAMFEQTMVRNLCQDDFESIVENNLEVSFFGKIPQLLDQQPSFPEEKFKLQEELHEFGHSSESVSFVELAWIFN